MLPSVVERPVMLGIMVGRYRSCSTCVVVDVAVPAATSSRQFQELPQILHRRGPQGLRRGIFAPEMRHFFGLRPLGR